MFPVEVGPLTEDSISDTMDKMRTWLDHNRFEPAIFRFSLTGRLVLFRVDFTVETEANAFAGAFDGKLVVG